MYDGNSKNFLDYLDSSFLILLCLDIGQDSALVARHHKDSIELLAENGNMDIALYQLRIYICFSESRGKLCSCSLDIMNT